MTTKALEHNTLVNTGSQVENILFTIAHECSIYSTRKKLGPFPWTEPFPRAAHSRLVGRLPTASPRALDDYCPVDRRVGCTPQSWPWTETAYSSVRTAITSGTDDGWSQSGATSRTGGRR